MSYITTANQGHDSLRITAGGSSTYPLAWLGTMDGVSILRLSGSNGPGIGHLIATASGVAWRAPGSTTAGPQAPRQSGQYVLPDGDDSTKWVLVKIDQDWLPSGRLDATVELRETWDGLQAPPDADAATASSGGTVIRTLTLTNVSNSILSKITAWLNAPATGLEIDDGGGSWVSPTTEGAGLSLGTLAAGATATLRIRRTISSSSASDPSIDNRVAISWEGL